MSAARTARRRRVQAVKKFRHMAPLRRPVYKTRSAEASARRLAMLIATERRMAQKRK